MVPTEFPVKIISCLHPYYGKSKLSGKRNSRKPKVKMVNGIPTQRWLCKECQERVEREAQKIIEKE